MDRTTTRTSVHGTKRAVFLCGAASFLLAFLGTEAAWSIGPPSIVGAQVARIRAEQFTVVGDSGTDRVSLTTGPGQSSSVTVLDPSGNVRALIGSGNRTGTDPDAAGFQLLSPDGTNIAGLRTGAGGVGVNLGLADEAGHLRMVLVVGQDGTPAMRLLDADGNVTWSAP